MADKNTDKNPFVGYEYKKITVPKEQLSMYLDCYECFGWFTDEHITVKNGPSQVEIQMKRDRKLINRTELTRLQHHFESCANEIKRLEESKSSVAKMWTLIAGMIGTAFMAGSTFAITHEPPVIWLCILLAVPGFIGWILPCFLYRVIYRKQEEKVKNFINEKHEELYEVCEKGHFLL